jgi:hypothetical protein
MAELTTEERLGLAVRAHVAAVRADQAKARAALLKKRIQPVREAVERFVGLHGRMPDLDDEREREAFLLLLASAGGGVVSRDDLSAAATLGREAATLRAQAAAARQAVSDAMPDRDRTVREWVGVDAETFDRAVEHALGEGRVDK